MNVQKSKKPITEFVRDLKPVDKRAHFVDFHDLGKLPTDESEFNRFFTAREKAMKAKLKKLLEI